MYHYIRDDDAHDSATVHNLSIAPAIFETQMQEVQKLSKESVISLMRGEDFVQAWKSGCFPQRKIWIFTTDDSWSDTYSNLAPLAKKYSIPFFFGAIENRIDTPGFITKRELQELVQDPLFTLSSHSISHNDHSKMLPEREEYEICTSKKLFETLSGKKVETYIYPSGRIGKKSEKFLKKCGYSLAWSTSFGSTYEHDIDQLSQKQKISYILNRTRITRNTKPSFFRDLALRKSYKHQNTPTLSSEPSAEEYLQASPQPDQNGLNGNF